MVWEDWRSGHADIYGARVDVNGKVLDPGGKLIAGAAPCGGAPTPPNDCDLITPDVVWTGTDYVVGFQTVDIIEMTERDWWVHVDAGNNVVGTPTLFAIGFGADFKLADERRYVRGGMGRRGPPRLQPRPGVVPRRRRLSSRSPSRQRSGFA